MQVSSGRSIFALKMKIVPKTPVKHLFHTFLRRYSTKVGLSAI